MALAYYSTNPTLRLHDTSHGLVTLERTKENAYKIHKDGVEIGCVHKSPSGKKWCIAGTQIVAATRKQIINDCVDLHYERVRRVAHNACGEPGLTDPGKD